MPTIVSAMLFSRGPISRQPNGVQIENVAVIIPVLRSISESHASMRALEYKRLARFCKLLRFFIIGYCSSVALVVPQPALIHPALRFRHPAWMPPKPALPRLAE